MDFSGHLGIDVIGAMLWASHPPQRTQKDTKGLWIAHSQMRRPRIGSDRSEESENSSIGKVGSYTWICFFLEDGWDFFEGLSFLDVHSSPLRGMSLFVLTGVRLWGG